MTDTNLQESNLQELVLPYLDHAKHSAAPMEGTLDKYHWKKVLQKVKRKKRYTYFESWKISWSINLWSKNLVESNFGFMKFLWNLLFLRVIFAGLFCRSPAFCPFLVLSWVEESGLEWAAVICCLGKSSRWEDGLHHWLGKGQDQDSYTRTFILCKVCY